VVNGREDVLVDLVVHSLDNSCSGAVLQGVEAAAHDAGLDVVVSAGLGRLRDGRPATSRLDKLATRDSPGVLFHLAELSPSQYAWLDKHRVPFVMIDPALIPPPGVLSVGAANWQGGLTAAEHLLTLGHERIAVIGGHQHRMYSSARVAGYRTALAAAGIRHRPGYVRYGRCTEEGARRRMLYLLDLPEPPTAVFVCSDTMVFGVYEALAARGLRAPDDISVVGFDDLPESRWAAPALTTVRRPLSEMAATALRLLVRKMAGEEPESTRIELSTRLVTRSSTAPPRKAAAVG
jgi:DNA-binding LacI/PurR family transcriptional regulator